jgi:hypothetical protein
MTFLFQPKSSKERLEKEKRRREKLEEKERRIVELEEWEREKKERRRERREEEEYRRAEQEYERRREREDRAADRADGWGRDYKDYDVYVSPLKDYLERAPRWSGPSLGEWNPQWGTPSLADYGKFCLLILVILSLFLCLMFAGSCFFITIIGLLGQQ